MSHLCPNGAQGRCCEKDPRLWGRNGEGGGVGSRGEGGPWGAGREPLPAVEWQPPASLGVDVDGEVRFLPPLREFSLA